MPNRIERASASLRDSLIVLQSRSFPRPLLGLFLQVAEAQFNVDELCKDIARRFAGLLNPPDNDTAANELNEAAGFVSSAHPDRPQSVEAALAETRQALIVANRALDAFPQPGRT
jgi:hypothetical protein